MAQKIGIRSATIVIKDKKVLLVKSKYNNKEFYLFPGGGVEFGETIKDAAIRETFEETGVKVKIKDLFHINEYIDDQNWNIRSISAFFSTEIIEILKPSTNDSGKIVKIEWIKISDLDNYDIKPKIIVEMIKSSGDLKDIKNRYSIDYKV